MHATTEWSGVRVLLRNVHIGPAMTVSGWGVVSAASSCAIAVSWRSSASAAARRRRMSACAGETASESASSSIRSADAFASARVRLVHERAVDRLQRAQRVAERGELAQLGQQRLDALRICGSRSTAVSVWLSRSGQISGAGVRTVVEAVEAVADMA